MCRTALFVAKAECLFNSSNEYDDVEVHLISQLGLDNDALVKFRSCTNSDETSQVVMEYVLTGWPADKAQVDELAREYFSYREELRVEDGLLFKKDSLVVPRPMPAGVLDEIHGAHMGESKSQKSTAKRNT